jgi:hypothetical protein
MHPQSNNNMVVELAVAMRRSPDEIDRAIRLIRTGRGDLIAAVIAGKTTVDAALTIATRGRA